MWNYQKKVNPFLFVDNDCSKEFYFTHKAGNIIRIDYQKNVNF